MDPPSPRASAVPGMDALTTTAAVMAYNDRISRMEEQLAEQARRASRERAKLEKRHYDECQVLEAKMTRALADARQKEYSAKSKLKTMERSLAEASAEVARSRKKYASAALELESTRAYAQSLLQRAPSSQHSASVVPAAEVSVVAELARLRQAHTALAAHSAARDEVAEREREGRSAAEERAAAAAERAIERESFLGAAEAKVSRLERLLEGERAITGGLRSRLRALGDDVANLQPVEPPDDGPMTMPQANESAASLSCSDKVARGNAFRVVLVAARGRVARQLAMALAAWRLAVALARVRELQDEMAAAAAQVSAPSREYFRLICLLQLPLAVYYQFVNALCLLYTGCSGRGSTISPPGGTSRVFLGDDSR